MPRTKYNILSSCTLGIFDEHEADITGISSAMDEYMKDRCLELLEYMAKRKVICHSDEEGCYFNCKGETLTKEQIFENFL